MSYYQWIEMSLPNCYAAHYSYRSVEAVAAVVDYVEVTVELHYCWRRDEEEVTMKNYHSDD